MPSEEPHPPTGMDANTNRKSVFSRKWTLSDIDREGLSQVSCEELVDLADITVHLVGRAIHPYRIIYRIRWFMFETHIDDSLSEGPEMLFSAPQHQHWGVPVENHASHCDFLSYFFPPSIAVFLFLLDIIYLLSFHTCVEFDIDHFQFCWQNMLNKWTFYFFMKNTGM